MNWFFISRAILLVFLALLLLLVKRKNLFPDFKSIIPHIFILIFLGIGISMLLHESITRIFYSEALIFILGLVMALVILVMAVKTTAFIIFDFLFGRRQNIKYPRLIKDIVVIILYIFGALLIVKYYLNIQITMVLASSAVLTVVIGFALQDILGDLFSGIALNLDESLHTGDWIRTGEFEGRIEQFRWRSIRIRTTDNVLVLIPNQIASKKEVQRYCHANETWALRLYMGASYESSPDLVIETILQAVTDVPDILKDPPPLARIKSFDDFAIHYEIRFWINDFFLKDPIASELRRRIWYAFKRGGIKIPFPIRDVHIHRPKNETELKVPAARVIEILQNNEILNTISTEHMAALAEDVEVRLYGQGEFLIKENEAGSNFYHILEGAAEVLKGNTIVKTLKTDDYVGEISLFTGDRTVADVRITRESKILCISSEKFRETVKLNENMAMKLAEVIALRKAQLMELTRNDDLSGKSAIKKESENIFLRIKKYFALSL